ncbi:MAG: redoxin domain-containing protein [Planctomycetota bacterium]|jgi:hypothetical protein|nr:redoxin domain-containing protein [Planctomycetota bacterium]
MVKTTLLVLTTLLGTTTQEETNPKSAQEQFQALKNEFNKARLELSKAYRATKDKAEQAKIRKKSNSIGVDYFPRCLKLAKEYPSDPVAFDALSWIVTGASRFGGKEAGEALDLMAANHIEDKRLGVTCERLRNSNIRETIPFLETVLEKSPHHDVKGLACYSLATQLKRSARRVPANKDRANQLFQRIITEFGKVSTRKGTLGSVVKAELFEANNLVVGKMAPDIVGKDLDGVEFKLSDYRGKVVFLDFWGNW